MSRLLLASASTSLLVAAAPPPAGLAPYVHAGVFEPGDYRWMRGRFADASPADKTSFKAVQDWLTRCAIDEQARIERELTTMGVAPSKLPPAPYQNPLCRDVTSSAGVAYDGWPSFAAFSADLRTAEPIAGAFLWATATAVDIGGPRGEDLAQKLLARPLGEQILRFGTGWGEGEASVAPKLSPGVRAIVVSRIGMAIGRSDYVNTEYLKSIVDKQGWPKVSAVGERAANAAWLLVQHADDDPLFQLRALRLMEPMVASGEVSKQNHAYLYDRVMLKIAGTQRYATQMTCEASQRVPQPLEDANAVDRRRAEAGLSSLAEYQQQMTRMFGKCPS